MEIKIDLSTSDLERIKNALGITSYDDIHTAIIEALDHVLEREESLRKMQRPLVKHKARTGKIDTKDVALNEQMIAVTIIPTEETSWGISDKYNIKDVKTGHVLRKDIVREELKSIIDENKYIVASGDEKYL